MTSVALPGYPMNTTDGRAMQATNELGPDFKFNLDMNSGKPLGVSE